MKTTRKYLRPVQKSVYEGNLTQGQLNRLKAELKNLINPAEDGIVIYCIEWNGMMNKEIIGRHHETDVFVI